MSTSGAGSHHSYDRPVRSDNEEVDPLEAMLDKTGCKQHHYSLQDCMYEHRDWRKCQDLVQQLKDCMNRYEQSKQQQNK
ncbi:cytochrome c oxidase assembly factor 4 homolog, mitochondrial-like [Oppia nitens]|uniref:cytochrome c oxidase assembly factor 4 homolog, mitochondrial-like n=1 Tax=Oppia nitens TaxID=1686743 RepID=UPI0023DB1E94|nr:cytochrome c oxidase assembly factor 4 homolog, mitochondrial-like [Oppia nitens]